MRTNRIRGGPGSVYHCMTRTVNGERLFERRDKEVLRKMLWQVADFSGVEVLTYALMNNHFHVLVRVPERGMPSDAELIRRYRVLYPQPTKYEAASSKLLEAELEAGSEEAEAFRRRLCARMGDVSEFMKTLKQRFTIYFNKTHDRFGTLWAERFKSVLVEGRGNPLQTMATYIDLNPVRAGLVKDPKDYRFCGYAEAVAGSRRARKGLRFIWAAYADGSARGKSSTEAEALQSHRSYLFAKGAENASGTEREAMLEVVEKEGGVLSKAAALRCRVRYFTDGAILGSAEFVRKAAETTNWKDGRKRPPKISSMKGADWNDLFVARNLKARIFG